jgi:hypothetical protein
VNRKPTQRMTAATSVAMSALMLLFVFAIGCGGGEADAEAAMPSVDPRYATADAFVEYFNSLSTATPVRYQEIRREFYAENQEQRQMLEVYDLTLALLDLMHASAVQFDDQDAKDILDEALAPSQPASIVERSDRRAQATYRDARGHEERLYLVQHEHRWWISAYTLEYSHSFREMQDAALDVHGELGIDSTRRVQIARLYRDTAARIRRGEFRTQEESRRAIMQELARLLGI